MQFDDRPVHSGGQAEIIGVHNETAHGASLPMGGTTLERDAPELDAGIMTISLHGTRRAWAVSSVG
jgi:hypothetical protein